MDQVSRKGQVARSQAGIASNIHLTDNPEFTRSDFFSFFPAFKPLANQVIVPDEVLGTFFSLADGTVKESRFKDSWKYATALFIAHYCVKFLEVQVPEGATPQEIVQAGKAKGLATSKSVGPVSVSYDYSWLTTAYKGWGDFSTTIYGQQYIAIAKPLYSTGMYIW